MVVLYPKHSGVGTKHMTTLHNRIHKPSKHKYSITTVQLIKGKYPKVANTYIVLNHLHNDAVPV